MKKGFQGFSTELAIGVNSFIDREFGAENNPFRNLNTNIIMEEFRNDNGGEAGGYIIDHTGKRRFYPGTHGKRYQRDFLRASIKRILKRKPDKRVIDIVDPMCGSGTTWYVVQELQKEFPHIELRCHMFDLRPAREGDKHIGGFDAVRGEYPQLYDIVWIHHPYGPMYQYSKIWGGKLVEEDTSSIPLEDFYTVFVPKTNLINFNAFSHLKEGGEFIKMDGDIRKDGVYYPMLESLHIYGEIIGLPKKIQVNASSGYRSYPKGLMLIALENFVCSYKPDGYKVKVHRMSYLELDVRQMDEKQWTYTKIIEQELDRLGGIANLSTLYDAVYTNWSFKVANKPNWEARVRATLQESPMFINIERGVWGLSDRNFSTSKKMAN